MKNKAVVALVSLALLSACSEESKDSGTAKDNNYVSPYDLSKISVNCYEFHNEVRNALGAGSIIPLNSKMHIYTSNGKGDTKKSNACSPDGTDFPFFVVSNNNIDILSYTQDIGDTRYEFKYINMDEPSKTDALAHDIPDSNWPKYVTVKKDNGKGGYTTVAEVDLVNKTKTITQGNTVEVEYNYKSYAHDDFDMMLQQKTAMQLFQLANGQEPRL